MRTGKERMSAKHDSLCLGRSTEAGKLSASHRRRQQPRQPPGATLSRVWSPRGMGVTQDQSGNNMERGLEHWPEDSVGYKPVNRLYLSAGERRCKWNSSPGNSQPPALSLHRHSFLTKKSEISESPKQSWNQIYDTWMNESTFKGHEHINEDTLG